MLGITLLLGLIILFWSRSEKGFSDDLNTVIMIYGVGIPMFIMSFDSFIDLDQPKVFLAWYLFSLALLAIYILTKGDSKFTLLRSPKFDESVGINSMIIKQATSPLKVLFVFLSVYWPLNKLLKHLTGNCIVSTFHQFKWYSEEAKRKTNGIDVFFNVILIIIIWVSTLFC